MVTLSVTLLVLPGNARGRLAPAANAKAISFFAAVAEIPSSECAARVGVTVTATFPAEAAGEPLSAALAARPALSHPADLCVLGYPFVVACSHHEGKGGVYLVCPFTLTVAYTDLDVAVTDENSLALYVWDAAMTAWSQ